MTRLTVSVFEQLPHSGSASHGRGKAASIVRTLLMQLLALLLSLCAQLPFASASAATPQVTTAYFLDTDQQGPLDAYFSGAFTPFSGLINLGYQPASVWFALSVKGMAPDTPYFAIIRPALLEETEFYEVVRSSEDEVGLLPLSNKAVGRAAARTGLAGRTGMLVRGDADQSLYLVRVKTRGVFIASVDLQSEDAFVAQQSAMSVQLGLFLGTSLTLFIFVLFVGSGMPSRFYGLFLAFQTVLVTLVISMNHVFTPYMRDSGLDVSFSFRLFLPFSMICAGLFNIALLRFFEAPKKALMLLNILFALYLILLLVQILSNAPAYGRVSIGFFTLHCIISLAALSLVKFQQRVYQLMMLLCYGGLVFLSLQAVAVTWFFHAPGEWIYQWPMLVVSALSVLMFITVIYELNLLRTDRQDVKTQLALEQQKLEFEQQTNEQNSKLMSMLSHEFKNSLAIVTMELGVLREKGFDLRHARKAIDDLLGIIERCMLLEKSARQLIDASIEPVCCSDMLSDIISTHWGRYNILNDCPAGVYAFADEAILRIVLTNLVDNACKYGAAGKPVRIKVLEPEAEPGHAERIEIQVSNMVGEFGKPDSKRIFSKYYRAASVLQVSGSGLGLYLVETLSKLMHSEVSFSDQGETIVFNLNLPKAAGMDTEFL